MLAHHRNGADGGLTRLAGLDGGLRARLWWLFWDHVRLLPLARAKAMSAFMFCTREAFDAFGPFDEQVQISEEWPVLSGLWRARRTRFVHDRELTVRSSSRRMQLQRFGYTRTFAKYVWAVLHPSGRAHYTDTVRAPVGEFRLGPRPSAISLALAHAVSAAPMHTLRLRTIDRATWVEKRRRPGLLILLPLWNCWLTLFGEPVRVLSGPAWHERERAMHHARTGFDTVRSIPGSLLVPLLPGVPADDLLRTGSTDPALVITTAARALRTLHAAGESHGDAILRNVLVDPATRTAHWIDFETRHAAAVPPAHRRADDLWTLARSTAHCLGPGHLDTIATAMAAAGLDPRHPPCPAGRGIGPREIDDRARPGPRATDRRCPGRTAPHHRPASEPGHPRASAARRPLVGIATVGLARSAGRQCGRGIECRGRTETVLVRCRWGR
ncbi:hypothetical protein [Nocardia niigatensis]